MTDTEFGEMLKTLRPQLLRTAARMHCCSGDAAEDLISETTFYALENLQKFTDDNRPNSLLRWLTGILKFVCSQDRRDTSRRPQTVPADRLPDAPAATNMPRLASSHALSSLPAHQRSVLQDWLDGYSQVEIGRRHNLSRNTVALRIEEAHANLRAGTPDRRELDYDMRGAHWDASIYHRPVGVWRDWATNHPPDVLYVIYADYIARKLIPCRHRATRPR